MPSFGDILRRVRRRKLGQWAVAYIAGAWVVMQLVDVLGDRWAWPILLQRAIDVLLLVGFLVVLVLAWYHGEQGRQRMSAAELVIIASLLAVVGFQISGIQMGEDPGPRTADRLSSPSQPYRSPSDGDGEAPETARPLRLVVALPDSAPLAFVGSAELGIGRRSLAVSPNGRYVVYVAKKPGGGTRLCRRDLDRFGIACLRGTEGAASPFVSPDGRHIGFFAGSELRIVPAGGGQPTVAADDANPVGGVWTGDTIIWSAGEGSRLHLTSASGGGGRVISAEPLIRSTPQALPGRKITYSLDRDTYVLDLSSGDASLLLGNAQGPRFLSPSTLLFTRNASIMAVELDTAGAVVGTPRLVAEGVRVESQGSSQYDVSRDGTLVFGPGTDAAAGRLHWVDRDGHAEPLPFGREIFHAFRLSPDGRRLATGIRRASYDVWVYDLETESRLRLTREGDNNLPVWSPNGDEVYYRSDESGARHLMRREADGSGAAVVVDSTHSASPYSVLHDGRILVGGGGLRFLTPGDPPVVEGFRDGTLARASSDERWIAFTAGHTGRYEVYVARSDGTGRRTQISAGGGEEPIWSPGGEGLYYRNGNDLMFVPLGASGGQVTSSARPVRIFRLTGWINVPGHSYDVAKDGRSLVVVRDLEDTSSILRVVDGF